MVDERCVKVTCEAVTLKLTLNAKQLKKSLEDAVITPFLTAYSKRAVCARVGSERIVRVEVDGTMLGDLSIPASVVLLKTETVDLDIFIRPAPASTLNDDPFSKPTFSTGTDTKANPPLPESKGGGNKGKVDFDDDGVSEVEKLKEQRRATRRAREANEKAEASGSSTSTTDAAAPGEARLSSGVRVRVFGLTSEAGKALNGLCGVVVRYLGAKGRYEVAMDSQVGKTINVQPTNLQIVETEQGSGNASDVAAMRGTTALEQLGAVELEAQSLAEKIRQEAEVVEVIEAEAQDAQALVATASVRVAALQATVGKLQSSLDGLELGEVEEEEARAAARTRRKAVHARLEGELLLSLSALRRSVELKRAA